MHRVLLNGLAQQGVHNNELALFPVKRPDKPVAQRKAAELVEAEDRGILIAPGHSFQHLVFDLIALFDHGNRDIPLKAWLGEVAGWNIKGRNSFTFWVRSSRCPISTETTE